MYIKPEALSKAIYFKKGEKYSYSAYQNTISRLNNLGVFSYVRVTIKQSNNDSLLNQVDVTIDLTMAKNINMDIQADLVTKSTGYAGHSFACWGFPITTPLRVQKRLALA